MTNAELRTNFLKFNKVAREIRAKRLGFQSAAAYLAFLETGGKGSVAVVAALKKTKRGITTVPTIHIVDIADKSGSMQGGKDHATVTGINAGVNEMQRNKDGVNYTHTYCAFDTLVNITHVAFHPNDVPMIERGTYNMTALWDAIGMTVQKLALHVREGDKVLVNIYTDGGENASKRFHASTIKEMISDYSTKGWTFTFIGTERDVDTIVKTVNIHYSNTRSYDGTAQGMSASMQATNSARSNYVGKVTRGEDVSEDFYKDIQ